VHYLLDTNICIYIAKYHPPEVAGRFERLDPGEVGVSMITYGELLLGAKKSQYPGQTRERLQRFILTLVSNNLREFSRIAELKTENWTH